MCIDTFYIGNLKGVGKMWQLTACDAASSYAMAKVVPDSEFLGAAADALDGLDFAKMANEVRDWAAAGGAPDAIHDAEGLSNACMRAAVNSNDRGAK